jgi:hypothetical protein
MWRNLYLKHFFENDMLRWHNYVYDKRIGGKLRKLYNETNSFHFTYRLIIIRVIILKYEYLWTLSTNVNRRQKTARNTEINTGEICQYGVVRRRGRGVDWTELFPCENKQEPLLLERKFSNDSNYAN